MVMTEYSIDLRPRQSFSEADAVSATETAVAAAAAAEHQQHYESRKDRDGGNAEYPRAEERLQLRADERKEAALYL